MRRGSELRPGGFHELIIPIAGCGLHEVRLICSDYSLSRGSDQPIAFFGRQQAFALDTRAIRSPLRGPNRQLTCARRGRTVH